MKTFEVIKGITCDICKKAANNSDQWHSPQGTTQDINRTVLMHRVGHSYPINHGVQLEVDICPDCFETKIIPFLKLLGVDPQYKTYHD